MNDKDTPANPNPFAAFEGERTLIKPSAGRAPRAGDTPAAAAPPTAGAGLPPLPDGSALPPHASLNPLVQCAAPLLAAAPRLRATLRHPDPAALRAQLAESVRRFEAGARAQGLPNEQVVAARYVLCTLLDEAASSTPWGGSGAWAAHSLLVQFHNEGWGGEKVFQLLTRLAENPAQHRHLLELVYVTLSLGFEGRYKVLNDGRAQLDDLRGRLATMLRNLAGPADRTLSLQWAGIAQPPQRLRDGVPLWVVAAGTVLLLAGVFAALRLSLNVQTDATFGALQALDAKTAAAPPAPPPAAPAPPRLAQLLQADIAAKLVQVDDQADRSTVTVLGDTLFDPGSADVAGRAVPLFSRIAAALNQVPGQVLISGHSDNQPIRSLRFPSNWHLSQERAGSVLRLLAANVQPARLRAEGRADTEPVADNATAEGRARNRRVEIQLTAAAPN
ncbi:MAG TPA: DotU family type VI secretion system protein [Aquabacterium sp.]|nr:DotU family type VI secretion system protein [Aquabacterium sp.]HQC94851.1 DotU family type VI secretion system protein [Aquabacterium sp.]